MKRKDLIELIDDIVNHHYVGAEHFLAEDLIKEDKKFAELLHFELQMQLMFDDKKTEMMNLEE